MKNNRYKIIKPLATGGMGKTYIVEDTQHPQSLRCVLKQLQPANADAQFISTAKRLFKTEAEKLKILGNHPQIPQLLDEFEEEGEFYIIQEFIDGHPLSAEMPLGQRWKESQVIALLQDLLPVLQFIHEKGVIHRDIKPDNIIRRSQDDRLVLIDFGAVKQIRLQTNATGQISNTVGIGTMGYMPMEQASGKPLPCSDIYALGMVAIQALTGLLPSQLRNDHQTGEFVWQDQTEASEGLIKMLENMTKAFYTNRYRSAKEVLQILKQKEVLQILKQIESKNTPKLEIKQQPYTPTVASVTPEKVELIAKEELTPKTKDIRTKALPIRNKERVITYKPKQKLWQNKIVVACAIVLSLQFINQLYSYFQYHLFPQTDLFFLPKGLSSHKFLDKILTSNDLGKVTSISFSPDGASLATVTDKVVIIWDLVTGKEPITLRDHSQSISSISFSPDGEYLVSGSKDETIKLWQVSTGEEIRTLTGHSGEVWKVLFSPKGDYLISSGYDQTIKFWDVLTGEEFQSVKVSHTFSQKMDLDLDGKYMAITSDQIKIWAITIGKLFQTLDDKDLGSVEVLTFSPNGEYLTAIGKSSIKLWNVTTGEEILTLNGHSFDSVEAIAFSPEGKYLATNNNSSIKLWDIATGKEILTLNGHSFALESLSFSSDGQYLASGGQDKTIKIWQVGNVLYDRISPKEFLNNYFNLINAENYRTAWAYLTPSFQAKGTGYESYLDWWQNKVKSVKATPTNVKFNNENEVTISALLQFEMKDKEGRITKPEEYQYVLLYNSELQTWQINKSIK